MTHSFLVKYYDLQMLGKRLPWQQASICHFFSLPVFPFSKELIFQAIHISRYCNLVKY